MKTRINRYILGWRRLLELIERVRCIRRLITLLGSRGRRGLLIRIALFPGRLKEPLASLFVSAHIELVSFLEKVLMQGMKQRVYVVGWRMQGTLLIEEPFY